jgi:Protein of unknown function (DUF3105)
MSKKLQDKQRRRVAEQMRRDQQRKATRRSNLITLAIAIVIIGAVTFLIVSRRGDGKTPPAPEGVRAVEAGCDPIEEHEEEGNRHVEAGADVEYETVPPTSGDHWPTANVADAGFYPQEVAEESLVHNMEHGQIVIWYAPDSSSETIDNLEALAKNANDPDNVPQGAQPIIVVPYDDVPEGKSFVLTAWTQSQACGRYSLGAINDFREKFQGRGPEAATAPFVPEA